MSAGGRKQTNVTIDEPAVGSVLIFALSPRQTIYLQKIVYSPVTIIQGTVINFVDSVTGLSIGQFTIMPPSISQPPYVVDYGLGDTQSAGTPLSQGANLILSVPVGGVNGRLHIKAYQIPLPITRLGPNVWG